MRIIEAIIKDIGPPSARPVGVHVGLHWTCVRSRFTGMSHTYKPSGPSSLSQGGRLSEMTMKELCAQALSYNTLDASVGVAAMNSLIEPRGVKGNVNGLFKRMARGKVVSIIGRFPSNDEIKHVAKECYLLEMDPERGEYPSYACEELLPKCDVNLITATTIINHTLDRLLELGGGGYNIVLGPSTPFHDLLFERGASILAGVRVTDEKRLVSSITQGVKKFKDIGGIEPIYLKRR